MAPYQNTRTRSPQKVKPANADSVAVAASDSGEGSRAIFPRETSFVDWTSVSTPQAASTGQPRTDAEGDKDTQSENSSERSLTPTPSRPFGGTTSVQGAHRQLSQEATTRACSPAVGGGEGSRQASGNSLGANNGSLFARNRSSSVAIAPTSRKELLKAERKAAREEAQQHMNELSDSQAEISRQIMLTESNLVEMQARMAALEGKKAAMAGMMSSLKECSDTESLRGSNGTCTISTCNVVVKEAGYEGSTRTSDLNLMDETDFSAAGSDASTKIVIL